MSPPIRKLLDWYRQQGRDLPWRQTKDAYRIFMSELMLQQTQVDRVIPLYQAWLKKFPSWKKLSLAPTKEIIQAWAGLGYNRRALYAREAAGQVVSNGVPADETGWRQLKGVGPYMAAALTEFVSGKRAMVIDTNIRRVVGRVWLRIPFAQPQDDEKIRRALEKEVPQRGAHADIPQAMMDLASLVCSVRNPNCAACPLRKECRSRAGFQSGRYLAQKPTKKNTERIRETKPHPDRIYRGRILALVREAGSGAVELRHIGMQVDPDYRPHDQEWIGEMVTRMIKDGLIRRDGGVITLP